MIMTNEGLTLDLMCELIGIDPETLHALDRQRRGVPEVGDQEILEAHRTASRLSVPGTTMRIEETCYRQAVQAVTGIERPVLLLIKPQKREHPGQQEVWFGHLSEAQVRSALSRAALTPIAVYEEISPPHDSGFSGLD